MMMGVSAIVVSAAAAPTPTSDASITYIVIAQCASNSHSLRWIKYIPIKVNIFAWRARQDCLPTRVNLIRRGITIESSLCPVCSVCEEDVCHIFFRCDLAQLVLRRICRWWGLDPHDWSSFQEWQSWILSIQFSSKVKAMLEGVSPFNPKMGSFRSKEDDVSKILTSIFVTNFPDSFSAKDLFHSCKQYGHVVDEEEDELSVEDNNDGRINDLEANNGIDESDVEEVLETLFDQPDDQNDKHSEDPFGLYPFMNKENIELARKVTEEDHSLSHLPGFTPEEGLNEGNNVNLDMKDYGENERDDNSFVNLDDGEDNSESVNKNSESKLSGHSKYSVLPRTGGSILNLIEEVVKVGQTMGYNMDGCIKDITEIIESQGEFGMGSIDLSSVRSCWGNSIFDYVHSDSVGIDLMIVVVYAPQEAKEKRMLWDYLAHVSNQWVDKLVMMGDFNEVRYKSDIYGSNFNAHDAEIYNSFIYNAGLDEVPLGGSAYTWFISDIVLFIYYVKGRYDYGPIPFRFYRYTSWKLDGGFGGGTSWLGNLGNVLLSNSRGEIYFLKEELRSCDEVIDKGDCSNEVVHKRTEILNKIHQVNNIQASEIAQKAKIKWAIEGDENVKFFHGMLNKKRNQSNIRGIMVNGTWVDDPVQVKREFFEHFRGRFDKPSVNRACIDTPFPVSLSIDQKEDMERMISKEEVKRAVWDCGVDKSPVGSLMARIRRVTKLLGLHPIEAGEWGEHAVLVEKDYALRYRLGGISLFGCEFTRNGEFVGFYTEFNPISKAFLRCILGFVVVYVELSQQASVC
ncbi:RNA-directed DNA polymerase, eukaryota [Tanacetum coccineum]